MSATPEPAPAPDVKAQATPKAAALPEFSTLIDTPERASIPDAKTPAAPKAAKAPAIAPQSLAPAESDGEKSAQPWDGPIDGNAKDYALVTVFYGTDRKATDTSDARVDGYDGWFGLTAICAAATIAFCFACALVGPALRGFAP